jgi:hypothetical protein
LVFEIILYGCSLFLVLGIILLYFGITSDYTWKAIPVQGNSTMYNLHMGICIGSALLMIAIILFFSVQASKKSFFYETDLYAKPLAKNETFIVVTDDTVTYSDSLIKQEFKWIKFSGFVYKKGFLMLIRSKKVPTSLIVHESECDPEEFNSILKFVTTKLSQIS